MGTPVCADDPSGDKNVLITRAAPRLAHKPSPG